MPIKVQTGETALQLAKAYEVKGSIPLELDETIVPVHIVGALDPTEPTIGPAPIGSRRAWTMITPAGSGAGSNPVNILDVHPNSAEKPNILIESIRFHEPTVAGSIIEIGCGLTASPNLGSIGTVQRFHKLDRVSENGRVPPFSTFISSGVPPSLDLRIRGCAYVNAVVPGVIQTRFTMLAADVDREIPIGMIIGNVASRTQVGNEFWEDANVSNEAMNQGNAEFWVRSQTQNTSVTMTVRLSVLP